MPKPPSADSILRNMKKQAKQTAPSTPIATEMHLPNFSVVKPGLREGRNQISTDDMGEGSTNLYYTDARVGTYGDTAYLKLNGSNANTNVDIGNYEFKSANLFASGREVFIGNDAGGDTLNQQNICIGDHAGTDISAHNNVLIGYYAGNKMVDNHNNFFLGAEAGRYNVSNINVCIGAEAGRGVDGGTTTGGSNFYLGYQSGRICTTGNHNIGIGVYTFWVTTTGAKNIAIGSESLGLNVDGNNNVAIGYNAGNNNGGDGRVLIGHEAGKSETTSNRLHIDNSDTATPLIYGEFDNDLVKINGKLDQSGNELVLPVKTTTGDPASPQEGQIYVNTFDNKVRVYADSAWRDLATW